MKYGFLTEVALNEMHPFNRLDIEDVQRKDARAVAQAPPYVLTPAAGCSAQIDNRRTGTQQAISFVQFGQLIDRT